MGSQVGLLACVATCCFTSFSEHVFVMASAQNSRSWPNDCFQTQTHDVPCQSHKVLIKKSHVDGSCLYATGSHPRTLDDSTSKVGLFICTAHPGLHRADKLAESPIQHLVKCTSTVRVTDPSASPDSSFTDASMSAVPSHAEPTPEGTVSSLASCFGSVLRQAST